MHKQYGFIDIPKGVFETLGVLALVGAITLCVGIPYGIWLIVKHLVWV